MIADKDLISIQYARILAENAHEAQKKLATFSQEQLDMLVECAVNEVEKHCRFLATLSYEETDFGCWQDKWFKNYFVCTKVHQHLKNIRCVGVLKEDHQQKTVDIGIPMGVIIALPPVTSPVSTTIHNTLLALKSGNAIIFSPHPRAFKSISTVLDILIRVLENNGLPKGALSYLNCITKSGTLELIKHPASALVMITGVPSMFHIAKNIGKPIIYGGTGNGPAFIERTANIDQAVADIIQSKTFDYGIAPSAEHSVVVDAPIAQDVKKAFKNRGAYFMSEEESNKLIQLFFHPDGRRKKDIVGKPAVMLARRAGLYIPENTTLLIAERTSISGLDPYSKELLAPILSYYVEDDWMHACEKCIELLLHERNGHTLVIHSQDESVIREFALKKPVGRLLINTPATFGGIGATTNLFPSLTLGSATAGYGITTDNVTPHNLVYIRKIGYGVRSVNALGYNLINQDDTLLTHLDPDKALTLQKVLLNAIKMLDTPN